MQGRYRYGEENNGNQQCCMDGEARSPTRPWGSLKFKSLEASKLSSFSHFASVRSDTSSISIIPLLRLPNVVACPFPDNEFCHRWYLGLVPGRRGQCPRLPDFSCLAVCNNGCNICRNTRNSNNVRSYQRELRSMPNQSHWRAAV